MLPMMWATDVGLMTGSENGARLMACTHIVGQCVRTFGTLGARQNSATMCAHGQKGSSCQDIHTFCALHFSHDNFGLPGIWFREKSVVCYDSKDSKAVRWCSGGVELSLRVGNWVQQVISPAACLPW